MPTAPHCPYLTPSLMSPLPFPHPSALQLLRNANDEHMHLIAVKTQRAQQAQMSRGRAAGVGITGAGSGAPPAGLYGWAGSQHQQPPPTSQQHLTGGGGGGSHQQGAPALQSQFQFSSAPAASPPSDAMLKTANFCSTYGVNGVSEWPRFICTVQYVSVALCLPQPSALRIVSPTHIPARSVHVCFTGSASARDLAAEAAGEPEANPLVLAAS